MKAQTLRDNALEVVSWFEREQAELGCDPAQVAAFAARVRSELDRDLTEVEPRCALLSMLDRPRRYRVLKAREAPAVVLEAERANLHAVPQHVLECSEGALFEPRPRAEHRVGELVFRYRSYWDGLDTITSSEETSLESGWTSVDFSDLYLAKLAEPGWGELWRQQRAILRAHSCQDFPLSAKIARRADLDPADLRVLKSELEGAGKWDGMLETPFFVARLAALLGPPPEAWGGGSYGLVGELDGQRFSVVATESQGHGIRHMVGVVGRLETTRIRAALDDFVNELLAAPKVGDSACLCFHYDNVFEIGARNGALFYAPLPRLPFWVDAFARYGA